MLVINKADGALLKTAKRTCADYMAATKWHSKGKSELRGNWKVPVLLASAKEGKGVSEIWERICEFRDNQIETGALEEKRRQQGKYWMWKQVQEIISAKVGG